MSRNSYLCQCGRRERDPIKVKGLLLCRYCAEDDMDRPPARSPQRPDFRYVPPVIRRTG